LLQAKIDLQNRKSKIESKEKKKKKKKVVVVLFSCTMSDAYGYDEIGESASVLSGGSGLDKGDDLSGEEKSSSSFGGFGGGSSSYEGSSSKNSLIMAYVIGGITYLFAAISIIFCAVYGIKDSMPQHFLLAALILGLCVLLFFAWRWSLAPDVEAKFKFFVIAVLVLVLLSCITAQLYVWVKPSKKHCSSSSNSSGNSNGTLPVIPCTGSSPVYLPNPPRGMAQCFPLCQAPQVLDMASAQCVACASGNGTGNGTGGGNFTKRGDADQHLRVIVSYLADVRPDIKLHHVPFDRVDLPTAVAAISEALADRQREPQQRADASAQKPRELNRQPIRLVDMDVAPSA
jgi:Protein of unknown function (DUF2678)